MGIYLLTLSILLIFKSKIMTKEINEELKKALASSLNDEVLNSDELNATEGGHNISLGRCGDNTGNCVRGCACTIKETEPDSTIEEP